MKHAILLKIKRYYWLLLLLIPFLIGTRSCSISIFLGKEEHRSLTDPCAERIPTPSPLLLTPVPSPSQEPQPEGTPMIVGGTPVIPLPPVILPPPPPWEQLFSVSIQDPYVNDPGKCAGTVSPRGHLEGISEGSTIGITVTMTVNPPGIGWVACYIVVDGISHSFSCPAVGGTYTYSLEVTGNYEVIPRLEA